VARLNQIIPEEKLKQIVPDMLAHFELISSEKNRMHNNFVTIVVSSDTHSHHV
jgi:hypothetical protein